MASLEPEVLRHALKVARDHGYAEVEVSVGEAAFKATLEPAPKRPKTVAISAEAESSSETPLATIRASSVGYYRPASTPLAVGQGVAKGDVVAVISALGLANDVESTVDGEIVEVLVKDGDPVQYGQVLAQVKA